MRGSIPNADVRVWSVGCASGEEAYSIGILLLEAAARRSSSARLQVFASDMHKPSLNRARDGYYTGDLDGELGAARLNRYFRQEGGGYRIRKEVRDLIVFAPHNLLADPPFSRVDLIVCRNLLIYLQRDVQRDVAELFHYALAPGGILVVGTSETIDESEFFDVVDKRLGIYRKRNVAAPEPRLPVFPLTKGVPALPYIEGGARQDTLSQGALHQRLVERYSLPSLMIGPHDKVLHLSENAGRFLVHSGGEPTASVFKIVRKELHIELRSALQTARDQQEPARGRPVRLRMDGGLVSVTIHARPATDAEDAGLVLIVFDEEPNTDDALVSLEPGGNTEETIEQVQALHSELELTRHRLHSLIEAHEISEEDMKASNEELQSINEELRSTLEELETSKEELQSMNEELQTVNQENRHKVEELAQISSDLQSLLSATGIATLFLDRNLRIMRFTPKITELFSVRLSDRGRPLSDFTHRLGYGEILQDANLVLEQLTPVEREVRDDAGRWYLVRILPYRSAEDKIEGVVVTLIDVSRRKHAENAQRDTEEKFRVLVEAASQAVWEASAEGVVVADSPSHRAQTGQTLEQWLGYGWLENIHPEDRDDAERHWQQCIASGAPVDLEVRLRGHEGSWRWTNIRAAPVQDSDGAIVKWVAMNLDITERKQAEEAMRESSVRKEEFIATLAHELRNPLAAISNGIAVLKLPDVSADAAHTARTMIGRQISQLVRLIDDLLDLKRIDRGIVVLRKERVDLCELLRAVLRGAHAASLRDRKLEVRLPSYPVWLKADPVRMTQVITNLLDNALKFTSQNDRIAIAVEANDDQVELSIEDEGIGIAKEKLEWIFEMFSQVTAKGEPSVSGLGIGLTLAKRLVELHEGIIRVASAGPGRGSSFTIVLRCIDSEATEVKAKAKAKAKADEKEAVWPRHWRVLVVDDNEDAAMSLAMLLKSEGNEVQTVHDGGEAVRRAESFRPDLVLLDLGLPTLDGFEVARRIRREPWGADMRIVAVTGWGQESDGKRSAEAGCNGHLVKPLDFNALRAFVSQSWGE